MSDARSRARLVHHPARKKPLSYQPNPQPMSPPVNVETHFTFAVIATVFATLFSMLSCCCLPLGLATGIPAILAANKVKMFNGQGDEPAALQASNKAKTWSMVTAGLAVAFALIFGLSMFLNLSGMAGKGGLQQVLQELEKAQKHQ